MISDDYKDQERFLFDLSSKFVHCRQRSELSVCFQELDDYISSLEIIYSSHFSALIEKLLGDIDNYFHIMNNGKKNSALSILRNIVRCVLLRSDNKGSGKLENQIIYLAFRSTRPVLVIFYMEILSEVLVHYNECEIIFPLIKANLIHMARFMRKHGDVVIIERTFNVFNLLSKRNPQGFCKLMFEMVDICIMFYHLVTMNESVRHNIEGFLNNLSSLLIIAVDNLFKRLYDNMERLIYMTTIAVDGGLNPAICKTMVDFCILTLTIFGNLEFQMPIFPYFQSVMLIIFNRVFMFPDVHSLLFHQCLRILNSIIKYNYGPAVVTEENAAVIMTLDIRIGTHSLETVLEYMNTVMLVFSRGFSNLNHYQLMETRVFKLCLASLDNIEIYDVVFSIFSLFWAELATDSHLLNHIFTILMTNFCTINRTCMNRIMMTFSLIDVKAKKVTNYSLLSQYFMGKMIDILKLDDDMWKIYEDGYMLIIESIYDKYHLLSKEQLVELMETLINACRRPDYKPQVKVLIVTKFTSFLQQHNSFASITLTTLNSCLDDAIHSRKAVKVISKYKVWHKFNREQLENFLHFASTLVVVNDQKLWRHLNYTLKEIDYSDFEFFVEHSALSPHFLTCRNVIVPDNCDYNAKYIIRMLTTFSSHPFLNGFVASSLNPDKLSLLNKFEAFHIYVWENLVAMFTGSTVSNLNLEFLDPIIDTIQAFEYQSENIAIEKAHFAFVLKCVDFLDRIYRNVKYESTVLPYYPKAILEEYNPLYLEYNAWQKKHRLKIAQTCLNFSLFEEFYSHFSFFISDVKDSTTIDQDLLDMLKPSFIVKVIFFICQSSNSKVVSDVFEALRLIGFKFHSNLSEAYTALADGNFDHFIGFVQSLETKDMTSAIANLNLGETCSNSALERRILLKYSHDVDVINFKCPPSITYKSDDILTILNNQRACIEEMLYLNFPLLDGEDQKDSIRRELSEWSESFSSSMTLKSDITSNNLSACIYSGLTLGPDNVCGRLFLDLGYMRSNYNSDDINGFIKNIFGDLKSAPFSRMKYLSQFLRPSFQKYVNIVDEYRHEIIKLHVNNNCFDFLLDEEKENICVFDCLKSPKESAILDFLRSPQRRQISSTHFEGDPFYIPFLGNLLQAATLKSNLTSENSKYFSFICGRSLIPSNHHETQIFIYYDQQLQSFKQNKKLWLDFGDYLLKNNPLQLLTLNNFSKMFKHLSISEGKLKNLLFDLVYYYQYPQKLLGRMPRSLKELTDNSINFSMNTIFCMLKWEIYNDNLNGMFKMETIFNILLKNMLTWDANEVVILMKKLPIFKFHNCLKPMLNLLNEMMKTNLPGIELLKFFKSIIRDTSLKFYNTSYPILYYFANEYNEGDFSEYINLLIADINSKNSTYIKEMDEIFSVFNKMTINRRRSIYNLINLMIDDLKQRINIICEYAKTTSMLEGVVVDNSKYGSDCSALYYLQLFLMKPAFEKVSSFVDCWLNEISDGKNCDYREIMLKYRTNLKLLKLYACNDEIQLSIIDKTNMIIEMLESIAEAFFEDAESLSSAQLLHCSFGSASLPCLNTCEGFVKIYRQFGSAKLFKTKSCPIKFVFISQAGHRVSYLIKSGENMGIDQHVMSAICGFSEMNPEGSLISPYAITPLSQHVGVLSMIEESTTLYRMYRKVLDQQRSESLLNSESDGSCEISCSLEKAHFPTGMYGRIFKGLVDELKINLLVNSRSTWPHKLFRQSFLTIIKYFSNDIFERELIIASADSQHWFQSQNSFIKSAATMSMYGYILGIGDRHLGNILIDLKRGTLSHIDLNLSFERAKKLSVPETVPFRLTRNFERVFGPAGINGRFSSICVDILKVLREESVYITNYFCLQRLDEKCYWGFNCRLNYHNMMDSFYKFNADEIFTTKYRLKVRFICCLLSSLKLIYLRRSMLGENTATGSSAISRNVLDLSFCSKLRKLVDTIPEFVQKFSVFNFIDVLCIVACYKTSRKIISCLGSHKNDHTAFLNSSRNFFLKEKSSFITLIIQQKDYVKYLQSVRDSNEVFLQNCGNINPLRNSLVDLNKSLRKKISNLVRISSFCFNCSALLLLNGDIIKSIEINCDIFSLKGYEKIGNLYSSVHSIYMVLELLYEKLGFDDDSNFTNVIDFFKSFMEVISLYEGLFCSWLFPMRYNAMIGYSILAFNESPLLNAIALFLCSRQSLVSKFREISLMNEQSTVSHKRDLVDVGVTFIKHLGDIFKKRPPESEILNNILFSIATVCTHLYNDFTLMANLSEQVKGSNHLLLWFSSVILLWEFLIEAQSTQKNYLLERQTELMDCFEFADNLTTKLSALFNTALKMMCANFTPCAINNLVNAILVYSGVPNSMKFVISDLKQLKNGTKLRGEFADMVQMIDVYSQINSYGRKMHLQSVVCNKINAQNEIIDAIKLFEVLFSKGSQLKPEKLAELCERLHLRKEVCSPIEQLYEYFSSFYKTCDTSTTTVIKVELTKSSFMKQIRSNLDVMQSISLSCFNNSISKIENCLKNNDCFALKVSRKNCNLLQKTFVSLLTTVVTYEGDFLEPGVEVSSCDPEFSLMEATFVPRPQELPSGNSEAFKQVIRKLFNKIPNNHTKEPEKSIGSFIELEVKKLVQMATSVDNLCKMYEGWTSWI